MHALVVYESMYGNTHRIAEAIARGLRSAYTVQVISVTGARYEHVGRYDLIVAGGPTHAHGMSRPATRQSAISSGRVKADHLQVEPDAGGMSCGYGWTRLAFAAVTQRHSTPASRGMHCSPVVPPRASLPCCASMDSSWWLSRSASSWIGMITFSPGRRSGPSIGVPPCARKGPAGSSRES